ncbi:hypothetical protein [Isoptericola sp. NPDC055881]
MSTPRDDIISIDITPDLTGFRKAIARLRQPRRPNLLAGCAACDFHGPELDTITAAAREFHRAEHDVRRSFLGAGVQAAAALARWAGRTR